MTSFREQLLPGLKDFLITALYYIIAWAAGMAYINKFLGLW